MAKYPGIPTPTLDPKSLRDSVAALKQGFEQHTNQIGKPVDAAVTWEPDLSGAVTARESEVLALLAQGWPAIPALLAGMQDRDVMIGSRYVPGGGTSTPLVPTTVSRMIAATAAGPSTMIISRR